MFEDIKKLANSHRLENVDASGDQMGESDPAKLDALARLNELRFQEEGDFREQLRQKLLEQYTKNRQMKL